MHRSRPKLPIKQTPNCCLSHPAWCLPVTCGREGLKASPAVVLSRVRSCCQMEAAALNEPSLPRLDSGARGGDWCQLSPGDPSHMWWSQDTHQPYGHGLQSLSDVETTPLLPRPAGTPPTAGAQLDPAVPSCAFSLSCKNRPQDPNPQDFSVPTLSFPLQGLSARRSVPH